MVGFVLIALAVGLGWLAPVDRAVLQWVAARRDCDATRFAAALSIVGAGEVSLLLTAIGATVCLLRRQPCVAGTLFLLYLSIPVEFALKHWLAQAPPSSVIPPLSAC